MAQNGVERGEAPSWLFSFVDLAFLMLIGLTLLASQDAGAPDLGEIVVPRIGEKTTQDLAAGRGKVWQLRVHPAAVLDMEVAEPPFELLQTGGSEPPQEARRIDRSALRSALAVLRSRTKTAPLLAPHEDSRSQDLLDAAAMIEELWPSRRRAVVARLVGR
jgi:hypothetical protein